MEYALSAMASVSQYAARPFDTFVLIMEPNILGNMRWKKLRRKQKIPLIILFLRELKMINGQKNA